jgi:type IV secretory pathway VirB4 component
VDSLKNLLVSTLSPDQSILLYKIMNNSSTVLKEMQSLQKTWRVQNFTLTKDQQARYDELKELRKAFIDFWKENGRVWVGPSNAGKSKEQSEN